jgi:hypothetical protein
MNHTYPVIWCKLSNSEGPNSSEVGNFITSDKLTYVTMFYFIKLTLTY